jgi:hypothetical protein
MDESDSSVRGMHRLRCMAHGVAFEVRCDSNALLAEAVKRLPFATVRDPEAKAGAEVFHLELRGEDGYGFRVGDEMRLEAAEAEAVLTEFGHDLMIHVAGEAPERVFVHAGVVGWHGRAVVLPGTSFAGKTTLVAELVRAGATYYSDEFALVDVEGKVHPYARDLQMREPGRAEQRGVAVEQLEGSAGSVALEVGQVIFTRFEAQSVWRPEPVSAGMAVLEMMRHAIPVQRTPARVMASLTAMMAGATAWTTPRGDARSTAMQLLAAMK